MSKSIYTHSYISILQNGHVSLRMVSKKNLVISNNREVKKKWFRLFFGTPSCLQQIVPTTTMSRKYMYIFMLQDEEKNQLSTCMPF